MSSISQPVIAKETTMTTEYASVVYRVHFEASGVGMDGLSLLLKITDPAGTNVTLTKWTTSGNWNQVDMANVAGDYEVRIGMSNFASLGQYTIEIDSQDAGAGKLVTHFTMQGVYGRVASGTPSTTAYIIDTLGVTASAVDEFYDDAYVLFVSGSLLGSGPKKISAYAGSTTKTLTVKAHPSAPAVADIFYLLRY